MVIQSFRHSLENRQDLRRVGLHPDFWYPLARSGRLKKGKALAVSFSGDPIVLVRTREGKIFALEDRCAHRQVPLSLGVVEEDRLKCCYHAWCYGETGRVVEIPYLPKGAKPPGGVRSYPTREAYGHIFIFPGKVEKAEETPFPELPSWFSASYKTMYFSRKVRCHYSFMHENLMDMNHQFLHRRLLGRIKPTLLDYEKGEDWIEVRYKFQHVGGGKHFGSELLAGGTEKDAEPDSFDVLSIKTGYPYQTLNLRRSSSDSPVINLWVAYVPVDKEEKVNHSFGMLMIRKPGIPGLINLFWPLMRHFTESVFAEDRMAVEAEQEAYDLQEGDWNQEVFPAVLDLREILLRQGVPMNSPERVLQGTG